MERNIVAANTTIDPVEQDTAEAFLPLFRKFEGTRRAKILERQFFVAM